MATREPSLQEVLTTSFDYLSAGMHTMIPGIVLTVRDNLSQMTVDVQPSLNMRSEDGTEVVERSPILNVPLVLPISKLGGLTFPVNIGDPVALIFSMRGLDVWKRGNGYPSTPSDLRKFDKKDCVAIPGLFPMNISPNNPSAHVLPHSTKDVVLVHNIGKPSEVEIRLTESGDVRIRAASGKVYVDSDSSFSKDVNIDGTLTLAGINMNTHVHGGIVPGGSDTNIPKN